MRTPNPPAQPREKNESHLYRYVVQRTKQLGIRVQRIACCRASHNFPAEIQRAFNGNGEWNIKSIAENGSQVDFFCMGLVEFIGLFVRWQTMLVVIQCAHRVLLARQFLAK